MRILLLGAAILLVAGCSQTTGGVATETTSTPPVTGSAAPTTTPSTSAAAATAPDEGASIDEVIAFVEAGEPADEADYHEATLQGEVTRLDKSIAFVALSGEMRCATGETSYDLGLLSCLTQLADPPPEPTVIDGNWVSGWLDFPGDALTLGSVHGDPGIFSLGDGAELALDQSLKFGDYQCRVAQSAVFCVNYVHGSGFRFSDAGVLPFGCLQATQAEVGGQQFRC